MTRRIDLPPYPRGWYCVGLSAELAPGEVRAVQYFGRELVLFRTQAGEARLFDAYCPHLGAHFGHGGKVEAEELVCPFHGWRFGAEGECTAMPYGKRIPTKARAAAWPLRERDDVLLAWHDEQAGEPEWEMPAHRVEDGSWSSTYAMQRTLLGHPQEVLENTADFGHFRSIHRTHVVRAIVPPSTQGPVFRVDIESDPEALAPEYRLAADVLMEGSGFCHGPGLTGATIVPKDSGMRALQRLYATPIDDEHLVLHGLVNVGALDDAKQTEVFAEELSKAVFEQWDMDIPIWEHKVFRTEPALNETESAIPVFRRWFQQFY